MITMGKQKRKPTLWFYSLLFFFITACSSPLPAPLVTSSSADGIVLRQYLVSQYGDEIHKRDMQMTLFAEEFCWSSGKDAILTHKTTTEKSYVLYYYECQFDRGLPNRGLRQPLSIY